MPATATAADQSIARAATASRQVLRDFFLPLSRGKDLEFIEQFDHHLFLKQTGEDIRVTNVTGRAVPCECLTAID